MLIFSFVVLKEKGTLLLILIVMRLFIHEIIDFFYNLSQLKKVILKSETVSK